VVPITTNKHQKPSNEALLKIIVDTFGVPLRQVELKQGGQSRHKVVSVTGSKVEPENLLL
jgi:uncharacterized protein YggU (UPF0235/DUF167 family)